MKNKIILIGFNLLFYLTIFAQTPQNVDRGKGRGESIWDSTTTIVLIVAFFILMIVSRSWSKRIQQKRDENRDKDNEE